MNPMTKYKVINSNKHQATFLGWCLTGITKNNRSENQGEFAKTNANNKRMRLVMLHSPIGDCVQRRTHTYPLNAAA